MRLTHSRPINRAAVGAVSSTNDDILNRREAKIAERFKDAEDLQERLVYSCVHPGCKAYLRRDYLAIFTPFVGVHFLRMSGPQKRAEKAALKMLGTIEPQRRFGQ